MRPESLVTLLKLRRRTVEEARTALAEALRRQDVAEAALLAAEAVIRAEADRAAHPDSDDGAVEMFAAWLPNARRRAKDAHARTDHAVADAAEARAALTLARAALEAAETLQQHAHDESVRVASRRDQEVLDEAGRRPR